MAKSNIKPILMEFLIFPLMVFAFYTTQQQQIHSAPTVEEATAMHNQKKRQELDAFPKGIDLSKASAIPSSLHGYWGKQYAGGTGKFRIGRSILRRTPRLCIQSTQWKRPRIILLCLLSKTVRILCAVKMDRHFDPQLLEEESVMYAKTTFKE